MGLMKFLLALVCFVAAITPNHGIARLRSDLQGVPEMMKKAMEKEEMGKRPMIMKTRMLKQPSMMGPELQGIPTMMPKMLKRGGMKKKPMIKTTMLRTTAIRRTRRISKRPVVRPRPIDGELEPTPVPERGPKCDRTRRITVGIVWGKAKFGPYGGKRQYVDCITLIKGNRNCERGESWFQSGNRLIVKKGCGGVFEICLKNKNGKVESPEDPKDEEKEEDPKDEEKEEDPKDEEKDDRCSKKADGNYGEDGCESYYICVDEVEQGTQACQEGLLFNEDNNACDFSGKVNKNTCKTKKVTEDGGENGKGDSGQSGDTGEPEQGEKCDQGQADGYYAYDNCKKFYRCVNNMKLIPEKNECGDNELFNVNLNVCDRKENVDADSCSGKGSGVDDQDICSGKEDGKYGTNDCKSYYTCENGEKLATQDCQGKLLFNKAIGVCDWKNNVNENTCDAINSGDNTGDDSGDNNGNDNGNDNGDNSGNDNQSGEKCDQDQADGYYAYDNCKKFYVCVNNMKLIPEKNECGDDELFNENLNVCDRKENVDVDSCSGKGTGSDDQDRCAGKEDGNYGTDGCTSFYTCENGEKSATRDCQDGLLFNKKIGVCDWAYNVNEDTCDPNNKDGDSGDNHGDDSGDNKGDDSGDNNGSDDQSGDSDKPPIGRCKEGEVEGVNIKLEDCSGYYVCSGGYKNTIICPENTKYAADKGTCDFTENVDEDCMSKQGDDGGEENPNNPKKCTDEEKRLGQGAIEGCLGFFTCLGDFKVEIKCPETLLYDKISKTCKYDYEVSPNCMSKTGDQGTDGQGTDGQGTDGQGTDGQGTTPELRVPCRPNEVTGGYYTYGQGCKQFYRCDRSFGTVLECPKDQLFNKEINTCDWEYNVNIENDCRTGTVVTTEPPNNNEGETTTTTTDKKSLCDYKIPKLCESKKGRKVRTCRIKVNPEEGASVCLSLKTRLSTPLKNGYGVCKKARDWHYDHKSVTVRNGCKASFVFCIKKCQKKKTITCKRNICRGLVGRRKQIINARRVLKKGQEDKCRNNFIFGDNYITAPKRCWGKFRLCVINRY